MAMPIILLREATNLWPMPLTVRYIRHLLPIRLGRVWLFQGAFSIDRVWERYKFVVNMHWWL
jgi:hypothetical protein